MADRGCHSYGNNVVSGSAQVMQGDAHTHYHHHNEIPPQPEKYNILYHSLSFERMDARLRNVETAIPQTCEWLQSHEQFIAWTDHRQVQVHHGILWLKGKPGSGKSTIMRKTLGWVQTEWNDQITLSYFFNARAPGELEKSCLGLFRSLTYQLLSAREEIRSLFVAEFLSKEKDGRVESWAVTELQNFLLKLINTKYIPCLNIFVDALDEGDEDAIRRMVAFFEKTAEYSMSVGSVFRLCLSSRHYPHISIETGLTIVMENQLGHTHDIEVYIEKSLPGKNSALMHEIRDTLLRKAGSVFLWVVLSISLLKPLYNRGRVEAMKRLLEDIPSGLYDVFSAIMMRNTEGLHECITFLQWMLVSKRMLSANELYHAVQCQHASSDLDQIVEIDDFMIANYILGCSRGLVELTEGANPLVQFIHETARQFLNMMPTERGQLGHSWPTAFDFRSEICHSVVIDCCLTYLLHMCQKTPLTQAILSQHPMACYAAKFWWQHMRGANGMCSDRALDLASSLLTGSINNLLAWVQIYNIDNPEKSRNYLLDVKDLPRPIYYAALIGVPELLVKVMLGDPDVNAQGGVYGNALQAASVGGHEKVVQMLLEQGADVNARGGKYGNALQAASVGGHEKMVQMLLDKGTDVNGQGGKYGNALVAAAYLGHEQIVQLLLNAGAIVDIPDEYWDDSECYFEGDALQAASWNNHLEVVQILLNKGANVNADNVLDAALAIGDEKLLQMLLAAGANANAEGEYGHALLVAAGSGYKEIVEMLLSAGADVNMLGQYWDGNESGGVNVESSALLVAVAAGHEKIVQLLLDAGADVDIFGQYWYTIKVRRIDAHSYSMPLTQTDTYGYNDIENIIVDGNALQAASILNSEAMVQILLDNDADVNAQGGEYGNALLTAVSQGHKEVVQMLLDAGADMNVQVETHGNALLAAVNEKHKEVLQMLLDAGADVNMFGVYLYDIEDYIEGNALQVTSERGDAKMVQMLLDSGADVNAQGGDYGNALMAAAYSGHDQVVQLLLNAGAVVDMVGKYYGDIGQIIEGNALQAASYWGYTKVVQTLLNRGAEINMQRGQYENPLLMAIADGYEEIVQMLLNAGAVVDILDEYWDDSGGYIEGDALQAASYWGREKMVQILLERGADVNAQGGKYGNALQVASARGHEKVVQILLDNGADVNAQRGTTAIHCT